MDKEGTLCVFSATKKNEIMPFETTWVDLKVIMISEKNQMEYDK